MKNKNKTVVYTAISNNYDTLKEPKIVSPNCDYICFTDNTKLKSKTWQIREFPDNELDPTRKCRKVKILPHLYFPEYTYSIWVDGDSKIIGDMNELIKTQLINKKISFATLKNPFRDFLFDEPYACIKLKKDDKETILRQIEKYEKENVPQNLGLVESKIIIRKHNNPKVIQVMKDWWDEALNYSKRDQISFNYVVWKNNFKYSTMGTRFDKIFKRYFIKKDHKKTIFEKMINIPHKISAKLKKISPMYCRFFNWVKNNDSKKDRNYIINKLATKINAKTYLEVGCGDGKNFKNIKIKNKICVDPDPEAIATHHQTSDDFFGENRRTFDIIFVDGLHHKEQAKRDILNGLKCLNPNGFIVVHDCSPDNKEMQEVPRSTRQWTGDVWKAWVELRQELNYEMYVIDADRGVGIITKGNQEKLEIKAELNWENLAKNKTRWLNLISIEEFGKKILRRNKMLRKISNKIKSKRGSDNFFWGTVVVMKEAIKVINARLHYKRFKFFIDDNKKYLNRVDLINSMQREILSNTYYFGIRTLKNPLDMWVYQELLYDIKPDIIVEIGNKFGGSTLALAHILDYIGKGKIIGVDIDQKNIRPEIKAHPRIKFIEGDACGSFQKVNERINKNDKVLIIEDSSHTYGNTLKVLETYSKLVTKGSYFIVEDTNCHHGLDAGPKPGPYEAVETFLSENKDFESDRSQEKFILTFNPKGFLKRIG